MAPRKADVLPLKGAAPSKSDDDPAFDNGPVVSAGREAWAREKEVQGDIRRSRERWFQIGDALNEGQEWALDKAHTNKPTTRRYREFFGHWLQVNGFDDIDPGKGSGDRGRIMRLARKPVREVVEAYLATLTEEQRARYNSPSALWRAYVCPKRCNKGRPKGEVTPVTTPTGVDPDDPHEAPALALAYHVQRQVAKIDPREPFSAGTRVNLIEGHFTDGGFGPLCAIIGHTGRPLLHLPSMVHARKCDVANATAPVRATN